MQSSWFSRVIVRLRETYRFANCTFFGIAAEEEFEKLKRTGGGVLAAVKKEGLAHDIREEIKTLGGGQGMLQGSRSEIGSLVLQHMSNLKTCKKQGKGKGQD